MSRTDFAAKILDGLEIRSLLDVGCRQGDLADQLGPHVDYSGADLFPDERGRVRFLGDISQLELGETFDAVVALDILEHLDTPSRVFDKMVGWTDRYLLVSFPNCYDLKSRVRFLAGGPLGWKYRFAEEEVLDRHRWLMNREEILEFFQDKAAKHRMTFETFELRYGSSSVPTLRTKAGRLLTGVLPRSLTTETVCGLFTKPPAAA